MKEIIDVHYPDLDQKLLAQAMETFYWIRGLKEIQKKPSTSELLDWIQALTLSGIDVAEIDKTVPYAGVLLKKNQDIDAMKEIKEKGFTLKNWF